MMMTKNKNKTRWRAIWFFVFISPDEILGAAYKTWKDESDAKFTEKALESLGIEF